MYHGRRFNLNGDFEFMPEFDQTKNFPRPCDHLHRFPLLRWGKLIFAGLNPSFDFNADQDAGLLERYPEMSFNRAFFYPFNSNELPEASAPRHI